MTLSTEARYSPMARAAAGPSPATAGIDMLHELAFSRTRPAQHQATDRYPERAQLGVDELAHDADQERVAAACSHGNDRRGPGCRRRRRAATADVLRTG